jgi:hypothetical protein
MELKERVERLEEELEDTRLFAAILLSFLIKEGNVDFERFRLWRRTLTGDAGIGDPEIAFRRLYSVLEIEDEAEQWLRDLDA